MMTKDKLAKEIAFYRQTHNHGRETQVAIRMSKDEKATIEKLAKKYAGGSLTNWIIFMASVDLTILFY